MPECGCEGCSIALAHGAIEKGYSAMTEFNLAKNDFLIATMIVKMAVLAIKTMPAS